MKNQVGCNKFKLSVGEALIFIIAYYIMVCFLISIPCGILLHTEYVRCHSTLNLILSILDELISKILTIVIVLRKIKKDYELNFKIKYIEKFNFKLLICAVVCIVGFFLWFHSSIGILIGKIPVSKFVEDAFKEFVQNPYIMVISGIIIAPIYEEIWMRGIILEGLLNKYKPIVAIVISALIFGIIHFNIPQFINATILGMIFGVLYYKTRSLILCIVMHMLNNGIASFDIKFNIVSFFVGAVIFIVSIICFYKFTEQLNQQDVNFKKNSISTK